MKLELSYDITLLCVCVCVCVRACLSGCVRACNFRNLTNFEPLYWFSWTCVCISCHEIFRKPLPSVNQHCFLWKCWGDNHNITWISEPIALKLGMREFQQRILKMLFTHYAQGALCYKLKGRGFETRWGQRNFFNLPNLSSRTRPLGLLSL
jgi:hypothetical protein